MSTILGSFENSFALPPPTPSEQLKVEQDLSGIPKATLSPPLVSKEEQADIDDFDMLIALSHVAKHASTYFDKKFVQRDLDLSRKEEEFKRIVQDIEANMPSDTKIPTLDVKLTGKSTFAGWHVAIERYLDLVDVKDEDRSIWEVVTGDYPEPTEAGKKRNWRRADGVALLTIRKNCEPSVLARIETLNTAKGAFDQLKSAYEGGSSMEF